MLRRLPIELQNYVFDFIRYEKSKTLDLELNEYFYFKNEKKIGHCVHQKITDMIDISLCGAEFQYSYEYRQWRFCPEFDLVDRYYKVNITSYFLFVEIEVSFENEKVKSSSKIYFNMNDEIDNENNFDDIIPLEIGRFTHLDFRRMRENFEEDNIM